MNQTAISKLHLQTGCQTLEFHFKWLASNRATKTPVILVVCCKKTIRQVLETKTPPVPAVGFIQENLLGLMVGGSSPTHLKKIAEVKLDPFPPGKG